MAQNRRFLHFTVVALLILLALSLRMVYWQLVGVPRAEIAPAQQIIALGTASPTPPPTPTPDLRLIERGGIITARNAPLAYGNGAGRVYPLESAAHIVGYLSGDERGITGIEGAYDDELLGLATPEPERDPVTIPAELPVRGYEVRLTLDERVQQAAAAGLGNRNGAVVALDAETGAVLAMVSYPRFDPVQMQNADYVAGLEGREDVSLVNRAAQGLYPPGSTWKTVTLLAALDSGHANPQTMFEFGEQQRDENGSYYVYTVDGFDVVDPNHPESRLNLTRTYAVSANAAFARMGDEMGARTMENYAERLGFGRSEPPPFDIDASVAQLSADGSLDDNVLRAITAIGQGELLVSPLSVALMTAAVATNGDVPAPYLASALLAPDGSVVWEREPEVWIDNDFDEKALQDAQNIMIEAVRGGSGVNAAVSGFSVGGKTGTAETGDGSTPHAWFTGFIRLEGRTVAIAVIVENGGSGADVAAPIFRTVAQAATQP